MAPIKFEEQLKDKLEERKVAPSSYAWLKLSERLDIEESKKRKPLFWWVGIAASVAVFLTASILYMSNSEALEIQETLVKDELPKVEPNETILLVSKETKTEAVTIETPEVEFTEKNTTKQVKETPKQTGHVVVKNDVQSKTIIHKTLEVNDSEEVSATKENKTLDASVDEKFNTIVAELKRIKEKTNTVTDQQIDSLIKEANKELLEEKPYKEGTYVVDADALLLEVEEDIDQSLRTKIYEVLKNGFNSVKTAVADRNN